MYIKDFTLEQVGDATGQNCPVKVQWTFGSAVPQRVEIYEDVASNVTLSTSFGQVTIVDRQPNTVTVWMPAGRARLDIALVPRRLDSNGAPLTEMPDAEGVMRKWYEHKLVRSITTRGNDVMPPPSGLSPPEIREVEATLARAEVVSLPTGNPLVSSIVVKHPPKLKVTWVAGRSYYAYLVRWESNDPLGRSGNNPNGVDADQDGASGSFVLSGAIPGVQYSFNVKGRSDNTWGSNPKYSDWSTPKMGVVPQLTSLLAYLRESNIDPAGGVRRYLLADAGSVRSFMQLA